MDISPDYFQSSYREDIAEIRRALDPLTDVLRIFEDHFNHSMRGWPYSISSTAEKKTGTFSTSTNAMIAFALLATTDELRSSVLLPVARRLIVPGISDDARRARIRRLALTSLNRIAGLMRGPVGEVRLVSNTFGINDPFTITWLVEAHAIVSRISDVEPFAAKTAQLKSLARKVFGRVQRTGAETRVLDLPDAARSSRPPTAAFEVSHPFPLLRVAQLGEAAVRIGVTTSRKLAWMHEWFDERLRRNLADHLVTDSPSDAADLVFSLEGLLASEPTHDESMAEAVFTVLRESQARNAYWRPVRPFIATQQGHALLPLSIEVANSLLRSCHRLDSPFSERSFFSENLPLFKRYAQWLRSRLVQVQVNSKSYVGWHSENTLSENTIDLWETSQVLVFLLLYSDLLQRHVARSTLTAARLSVKRLASHTLSPLEYWEREAMPKEPLPGSGPKREVYRQIAKHFVQPRESDTGNSASHSMLLFGPPGTGKTGIAEDLASALSTPLITITPSDFLAEGPNEVEARAKVIFAALLAQADCVILFDEIDRLLLDRDAPMYHRQSDAFQFMTPSMLVKLKDLRAAEQTIFIIATNYYERIDPAARRVGRVDHHYLVMPPAREQRRQIILGRVKAEGSRTGKTAKPVGPMFRETLDRTVLYAFSELKSLARDALAEKRPTEGTDVARLLLKAAKEADPTIRIAAYRDRFPAMAKEPLTSQQPIEEFVALLELLEESRRLADAEPHASQILEKVQSDIRDEDLKARADRIANALRKLTRK